LRYGQIFQKQDTVFESASPDRHDQINGVEIFFTPEAPGQIGVRINRCLKFVADGAQKTKKTVPDFRGDLQLIPDQHIHRYVVPQIK
jgi:hypothetical protein